MEAASAGADIVMLDNFPAEELARDAIELKRRFPSLTVEASGGITEDTLPAYAVDGVDVVSMGALTQGYSTLDFSMKLPRPTAMAAGPDAI